MDLKCLGTSLSRSRFHSFFLCSFLSFDSFFLSLPLCLPPCVPLYLSISELTSTCIFLHLYTHTHTHTHTRTRALFFCTIGAQTLHASPTHVGHHSKSQTQALSSLNQRNPRAVEVEPFTLGFSVRFAFCVSTSRPGASASAPKATLSQFT